MGKQKPECEGACTKEETVSRPRDLSTGAEPCQPFACWLELWGNTEDSVL